MTASGQRYVVQARSVGDGAADVDAKSATIRFDGSWNAPSSSDQPGPGELLASAFAACVIKNVERFSQVLPFSYESAEIDVELFRQDRPPRFDRLEFVSRLVTDEPVNRVDLLERNLKKHGTVFNTLAASCDVSGQVVAMPARIEHPQA